MVHLHISIFMLSMPLGAVRFFSNCATNNRYSLARVTGGWLRHPTWVSLHPKRWTRITIKRCFKLLKLLLRVRVEQLLICSLLLLIRASLKLALSPLYLGSRILAIWFELLAWGYLSLINDPLVILHLHYLSLVEGRHDRWMLFLLWGRGPWSQLLWGVLAADDEVVYLREYLDIAAIVHHDYVVIVRIVFMDGVLVGWAWGITLLLSRW